jgi:CubicO group peptidase (beta-lactamase class C family)
MPRLVQLAFASLIAAHLLACVPSSPPAVQASPNSGRFYVAIDSVVQADVVGRGVTGVSIVIARGGQTLLEHSWGFADLEAKRPVDASTTFRIGSMSKQFTAALLLKQVDRGRLALTDTIGRYLNGLKPEWTGRTIEQLLNHTSGVPREFRDPKRIAESMTSDSLLAMAARSTAPTTAPGTAFIYSNTGYMLLGALVERLYGTSYAVALRNEIARPLGLETLGWCVDTEPRGGAKGYYRAPNGAVSAAPYIHPSQMLSGGICSNAGDIARWNRALHGGKVVSASSYAAMTTPRGVAATRSVPYGFGLYVRETEGGGTVIVHDGATPGYAGENVWYPAESLSVTMLYNTSPQLGADLNLTEVMGRIALGKPALAAK